MTTSEIPIRQPRDSIVPHATREHVSRIRFGVDDVGADKLKLGMSLSGITVTESVRRAIILAHGIAAAAIERVIVHDTADVPGGQDHQHVFDEAPFEGAAPMHEVVMDVEVNLAPDVVEALESVLKSYPEQTMSAIMNRAVSLNSQLTAYDDEKYPIIAVNGKNEVYPVYLGYVHEQAFARQLDSDDAIRDFLG